MKRHCMRFVILGLAALLGFLACGLREVRSEEAAKHAIDYFIIESRHVDIWSDGTRLSGDLWYPRGLKSGYKLPAVILCHWGGVRSHLNQAYASEIAAAGYVVLTFDYRGWGDSDSRLVIKEKMPDVDESGLITVRVQAIRELVDPFDQTEDIIHCIDFLSGEPGVDPNRIGLWGTSFGGGHVVRPGPTRQMYRQSGSLHGWRLGYSILPAF
jgi:dienelactone hydrolase